MKEARKTNSEYIIDALCSENNLTTPEIRDKVMVYSGKNILLQDIASLLTKMTNREKCSLGFFIQREKNARGFTYNLVPELFELSKKQIYDLTRRIGQDQFTLEDAVRKSPGLARYLPPCKKTRPPDRRKRSSRSPLATVNERPGRMPKIRAGASRIETNLESVLAAILSEISTHGLNVNIHLDIRF